jgi:hypothetical protein
VLIRRFLWSLLAAIVINLAVMMVPVLRAAAKARVGGAHWVTFSPLRVLISILVIAVVLFLVSLLFEWLYRWTFR